VANSGQILSRAAERLPGITNRHHLPTQRR
jgi:hypothetical protein